ncbi:MAG: Fic family protein [Erysipelotrichaceae bacterium]
MRTTPRTRDEEEIAGYRDILNTIHESHEFIPIKSSYILQLHKELYKYSEKTFGGRFKNTQNYIAEVRQDGSKNIRFTPLAPYETPDAIESICVSYNKMIDECNVDPLILIPIFITDFLCIHPFNDGNGRMSRLLIALLLYKSGYVVGKYISIEKKIEKTKSKYYEVLETVDIGCKNGNNDPNVFVKYFLGIILSCYRDFEDRLVLVENKILTIEMVKNVISDKLGKFTKKEINEFIPSKSRASIENSLKSLVEDGYIERHGKGKATFYTRKF